MDESSFLFQEFSRLFKADLINKFLKLIPLILFFLLSPVILYEEYLSGKYLTVLFILAAESIFLFMSFSLYQDIKKNNSFKKSRIYKCFENKKILNKIIISKEKILFDITGMEDEVIFIQNSEYKNQIISSLKSEFGESKLVFNLT